MKMLLVYLLFPVLLFLSACGLGGKSYPEEVFEKVKLNSNKIPDGFKRHFTEIRAQLKAGNLMIVTPQNEVKKVNATAYVANHYLHMFDTDIKAIESLKPDEETKEMLADALDMFRYADTIYKTDFPRIALMIDEGRPDEAIDAAIAELDAEKGPVMNGKYNKVHDKIIPYADKHGVEYKILNMPAPVNYK